MIPTKLQLLYVRSTPILQSRYHYRKIVQSVNETLIVGIQTDLLVNDGLYYVVMSKDMF